MQKKNHYGRCFGPYAHIFKTFKKCCFSFVRVYQGVTLGGTGKEVGDRHPKIGPGALIGAGATILGNITVGEGAMITAGSLVLKSVPPHRYEVLLLWLVNMLFFILIWSL